MRHNRRVPVVVGVERQPLGRDAPTRRAAAAPGPPWPWAGGTLGPIDYAVVVLALLAGMTSGWPQLLASVAGWAEVERERGEILSGYLLAWLSAGLLAAALRRGRLARLIASSGVVVTLGLLAHRLSTAPPIGLESLFSFAPLFGPFESVRLSADFLLGLLFAALGLSALVDRARPKALVWLSGPVIVIGAVGLGGHTIERTLGISDSDFTGVSVTLAVAFLLFAVALCSVAYGKARGRDMALLLFATGATLLTGLGVHAVVSTSALTTTGRWVRQGMLAREDILELRAALAQLDAASHALLAFPDVARAYELRTAAAAMEKVVERRTTWLGETRENATPIAQVQSSARDLISQAHALERFAWSDAEFSPAETDGFVEATDASRQRFEEGIEQYVRTHEEIMGARLAQTERLARYSRFVTVLGCGVALTVLGVAFALGDRATAERVRIEHELRASEQRFRLAFEASPVGLGLTTMDGLWLQVNRSLCRITGYTEAELLRLRWQDMSHPDDIPADEAETRRLVQGERVFHEVEKRYRHRDGHYVWVRVTGTVARQADGAPVYGIAHVEDITDRRAAAEALRASEERFRAAAEGGLDAFFLLQAAAEDPADFTVVYANRNGARLLRTGAETLIGRSLAAQYPQLAQNGWLDQCRHVVKTGLAVERELRSQLAVFHAEWIRVQLVPVAAGLAVTVSDITERKRAELQLRTFARQLQERNRELQDFAYVTSHDLQEPLRKIQVFGDRLTQCAATRLEPTEVDYLRRMTSAAKRMQSLIEALLAYSQVATRSREHAAVSLQSVVDAVISDLEFRLEQTRATLEVVGPLPHVLGDATQLAQLMQNLLVNALKYCRPGVAPHIRIRAEPCRLRDDRPGFSTTVEDNGIGFSNEYAETIFGVFTRLHTRDEYEGTGVGLAICRRIVERHGGDISAHGQPGQGARFVFTLPAPPISHTVLEQV